MLVTSASAEASEPASVAAVGGSLAGEMACADERDDHGRMALHIALGAEHLPFAGAAAAEGLGVRQYQSRQSGHCTKLEGLCGPWSDM